jgi:hypothetical protein
MTPVAVTPHPMVAGMQRNTFVCYRCNETRTYMLPTAAAEPAAKYRPPADEAGFPGKSS